MTMVRVGANLIDIDRNHPPRPFIRWDAKIKFNQFDMFNFNRSPTEKILSFSEHARLIRPDQVFFPQCRDSCGTIPCEPEHLCGRLPLSLIFKIIYHLGYCWRTEEYGFYPKGFEENLTLPFGSEIRWVEKFKENTLVVTLKIPKDLDVSFSIDGKTVRSSLQDAYGLGIVKDLSKLRLKPEDLDHKNGVFRWVVEFDSGINPEKDISVIDVLRPSNEASEFSPDFYPLRIPVSIQKSRFSSDVRSYRDFIGDATGWHGSLSCEYYFRDLEFRVGMPWLKECAVAVMDRDDR